MMPKKEKSKFNSKNVQIKEEELSITKIGEMNTENQSSIVMLILFVFILGFIFFLPNIVTLIKGKQEKPDYSMINNQEQEKEQDSEKQQEESFYTLSSSLTVHLEEKIVLSNFKLQDNQLSFTVQNEQDTRYYFEKENYFLELYSKEQTLLERIRLEDIVVSKGENVNVEYTLQESTSSLVNQLYFVKKTENDYPYRVIEKDEEGVQKLTCTNNHNTLTYTFSNDQLVSFEEEIRYSLGDTNYENLKVEWQEKSTFLNQQTGLTSLFVDTENRFVVNTTFDLQKANVKDLNNHYYYEKDTHSKVVAFEMEARGFVCK